MMILFGILGIFTIKMISLCTSYISDNHLMSFRASAKDFLFENLTDNIVVLVGFRLFFTSTSRLLDCRTVFNRPIILFAWTTTREFQDVGRASNVFNVGVGPTAIIPSARVYYDRGIRVW